jgi:hypothetical protein
MKAIDWQTKYPLACSEGIDTQFNAGWNQIVSDMFDKIEVVLKDMYNLEPERSQERENRFWIGQIKEKFASLRVYADIPSFWKTEYQRECDLIQEAINTAENLSTETCELCGEAGKVVGTGWLSCRCEKCNNYKLLSPLAETVVTDYVKEFLKTVEDVENPSEKRKLMDLKGYDQKFLDYLNKPNKEDML